MKPEVYIKSSERQIERLLSNMDRNKDSPTYGCLCRPYWHDKTMDFPSAHQQIGVLPLAQVYSLEFEGNIFQGSEQVEEYVSAGIEFWKSIQKKNGSFDEHYPNEHSMGAVAWTLWAVTEACKLIDNPPDIDREVQKAVGFLQKNGEPGDIANHQAVAASALYNVYELTGRGLEETEKRIKLLEEMQTEEGWFQEYIGADIGYQTTTISHLGRLWRKDKDLIQEEMIQKALDFLLHFIDQENYYAGITGSRNTQHLHPGGIEILAQDFEKAEKLSYLGRKNVEEKNVLQPHQIDDKHFSRELAEFMDAYRYADSIGKAENHIQSRDFQTVSIRKREDELIFVNTSKGGVFERYNRGELQGRNNGISIDKDNNIFVSNWPGTTKEKEIYSDRIRVRGELREAPKNTLEGNRFIASRLFNYSLGRVPYISLRVKNLLIKHLITGSGSGNMFERVIKFDEVFSFEDSFEGEKVKGKTRRNFVPSSEFFSKESLDLNTET